MFKIIEVGIWHEACGIRRVCATWRVRLRTMGMGEMDLTLVLLHTDEVASPGTERA